MQYLWACWHSIQRVSTERIALHNYGGAFDGNSRVTEDFLCAAYQHTTNDSWFEIGLHLGEKWCGRRH